MLIIPWAPVVSLYYFLSDHFDRNTNLLVKGCFVNFKCSLNDTIFAVMIWQISNFFSILKITAIIINKCRVSTQTCEGNCIRIDWGKRYEGCGI